MKMSTRIGIAAIVTAVVLIVVLAVAGGGERSYPADSPEATLQQFLQALFDEDLATAESLLSPQLRGRCDRADLRHGPTSYRDAAHIRDATVSGDIADLEVEFITEGLFGDGYESVHDFRLERVDGRWQVLELADWFGCQ